VRGHLGVAAAVEEDADDGDRARAGLRVGWRRLRPAVRADLHAGDVRVDDDAGAEVLSQRGHPLEAGLLERARRGRLVRAAGAPGDAGDLDDAVDAAVEVHDDQLLERPAAARAVTR
jgi:hypothetical protein